MGYKTTSYNQAQAHGLRHWLWFQNMMVQLDFVWITANLTTPLPMSAGNFPTRVDDAVF